MKNDTRSRILEMILRTKRAQPHDLVKAFAISPQSIHRHLNALAQDGKIIKVGKPPLTFYVPSDQGSPVVFSPLDPQVEKVLTSRFLYATPNGRLLPGVTGFQMWVRQTKQEKYYTALAEEYRKTRLDCDRFLQGGLIDATQKFKATFRSDYLDSVSYSDFYSLPKFGKTKLGTWVLHAKQAQDRKLIRTVAAFCLPLIKKLIKKHRIEAVAWAPHSIPRRVAFLKEFATALSLALPVISVVKAFVGDLPVAQKSLAKLEERIENAKTTLFVRDRQVTQKRILVIDDAVGSGATLEAIAEKIKEVNQATKVHGFAVVGSLKGFEVIREV